jgi:hypothetical protein
MARTSKKKTKSSSGGGFSLFDESDVVDSEGDEDLPKDEAGRQKIKQQYVDLLGIRIQKLRGRILNRERINKTLEGVYFICARCMKVCHNLDEGLLEDEGNEENICTPCSQAAAQPVHPARTAKAKKPAARATKPRRKK